MDLLIDSGNSRLKWAYSEHGRLSAAASVPQGEPIPAAAQSAWLAGPVPTRIIVANVAGPAFAEQLDQWVQRHWQRPVEYLRVTAPAGGIELAYARPERFGVDRWLALIAARRCSTGRVAVIDAGTAMTLDVLTPEGRHEGGIIVPGMELMCTALLRTSSGIQAGLQDAVPTVTADPLGKDTRSGIEKGALYAVTGAIEHTLARLGAATGQGLSVILCGGNAAQLMTELKVECQHIPDLVLRGMQILKRGS